MLNVQVGSLDWALRHAENYGDTDVFPVPFEYAAIRHDWGNIRDYLSTTDLDCWVVRPHRRLLAPKGRYGFRVATQLDPLDFLLFAALVYEIGADLERARVPVDEGIVHSHRFGPDADGRLFDSAVGYASFAKDSEALVRDDGNITHVVVTDIADFYHRIYLHRLENAMHAASASRDHVRVIMKFLDGWNRTETYGVPVGSAAARVLAETTLADVDDALLAAGVRFRRFNDDYRIFATSHSEAYRQLTVLADVLFRNHGLTLQRQKTSILTRASFLERYSKSEEARQLDRLHENFDALAIQLELGGPYEMVQYEDLTIAQKSLVDQLNLVEVYSEEIERESEPDEAVLRFALRRMGQLGDPALATRVVKDLDEIFPVLPDVIGYLRRVGAALEPDVKVDLGAQLLERLRGSALSSLPYHRLWILSLFADDEGWGNAKILFPLLANADADSRRKLFLALGRAGQRHVFQGQWRDVFNESPWPRRASIAAMSCLTHDARKHWFKSALPGCDPLEAAVVNWARTYPFT